MKRLRIHNDKIPSGPVIALPTDDGEFDLHSFCALRAIEFSDDASLSLEFGVLPSGIQPPSSEGRATLTLRFARGCRAGLSTIPRDAGCTVDATSMDDLEVRAGAGMVTVRFRFQGAFELRIDATDWWIETGE